MFSFLSDTNFEIAQNDAEAITPVLEKILADHGFSAQYINIVFMDDEQVLSINKEFLDHDYYTDIITFPYNEEGQPIEAELYISVDRVKDNAAELGVSFINELFRIIIHGVLHLVGYDDSTKALKLEMQTLENKYINLICFT